MEKPKAYPAKLRRPINRGDAILAVLRQEKGGETFQQWLSREQDKRLRLLIAHYGIKPGTVTSWKELALALATNHVPGFRISEEILGAPRRRQPSAQKKGRPRYNDEPVWRLINAMEVFREEGTPNGGQRITDKRILEDFLQSRSKKRAQSSELSYLQKLISRVRKTDPARYKNIQQQAKKAVRKIRNNSRS